MATDAGGIEDGESIKLSKKKYKELMRCLSIMKILECNDVVIRHGFIREKSYNYPILTEMDLTPLIGNMSLIIPDLKNNLKDLKDFSKGKEVSISATDKLCSFSDGKTSLQYPYPQEEDINQEFYSEEELISMVPINTGKLILSTDIPKMISKRMKVVMNKFPAYLLQVVFENNTACISATNASKDAYIRFMPLISINEELNHTINLIIVSFTIDCDEKMMLEIFGTDSNIVISKLSAMVGDVKIKMYMRSFLIENELVDGKPVH
jgi:hypothetical protein